MRKFTGYFLLLFLLPAVLHAQQAGIDSANFFNDEQVIQMKLSTDFKKLMTSKKEKDYQPATVTCTFPDSAVISEDIQICARGVFRRANCYIPSTQLDFKNPTSPKLSCLGKLKLVSGCATSSSGEQLLLKEYLIYKIYNLITEKSFKVRLLKITYDDTKDKVKQFDQYAFLIEDMSDLAKRNKCKELKNIKVNTQTTDRNHMTTVAIFQYMIGNTDWAIPVNHNIKLMQPKKDLHALPYVIPYDFDFAGLVNAGYATPAPLLGTESVTERVYRGFSRSMEEIDSSLVIFKEKKDSIYAIIQKCTFLKSRDKNEMIGYLDEFYSMIKSKDLIKSAFIDNARTQ